MVLFHHNTPGRFSPTTVKKKKKMQHTQNAPWPLGDRQETRYRRTVRAQIPAQRAGGSLHDPASERGTHAPHIRQSVLRTRVHGLLRDGRPAESHAPRQDHTAMAGPNVFQVSARPPPYFFFYKTFYKLLKILMVSMSY